MQGLNMVLGSVDVAFTEWTFQKEERSVCSSFFPVAGWNFLQVLIKQEFPKVWSNFTYFCDH